MKLLFYYLFLGLLFLNCNAHSYLSSVTVNGMKDTACLRPLGTNSPISSVYSPDMMCGFLPRGAEPAKKKLVVAAGGTVGLQWNHDSTNPTDDIIAASHKGPCLAYLSGDNGKTFFKIWEIGYNNKTSEFCVTNPLLTNKGYLEVGIPADIAPGDYLLRAEIIALHSAYALGGVQPYVDCAELTITGTGKARPVGVTFPGAYQETDPGILINIYQNITEYIIPGPPVYKPANFTMIKQHDYKHKY